MHLLLVLIESHVWLVGAGWLAGRRVLGPLTHSVLSTQEVSAEAVQCVRQAAQGRGGGGIRPLEGRTGMAAAARRQTTRPTTAVG